MAQIALHRPAFMPLGKPAAGMLAPLMTWYRAYQTRRALHALSDRQLADIGLSRDAIDTLRLDG